MYSERTAFLLAIVLVLAAALVVAPVAARTISSNGALVFIGEEDLSFVYNVPAGETVAQWVHYSDLSAGTIDYFLVATNGNISELVGGIPTGTYYVFTATGDPANLATAVGYVNVQVPDATLDVVLNTSPKDSVNGKLVTRDSLLDFKLMNNLNGLPGAAMNIEVTLPGGGVTTQFGGRILKGIPTDGTTRYLGAISLTDAAAGTYTARAKWPSTSDFYCKGYDSNTVTFEVGTASLSITSNKDLVVRGNSFTVTVTGASSKTYRLYVRGIAGLASGEHPVIAPGQAGVTPITATDATVRTGAAGSRSVQFNTSRNTADFGFTICVEDPADPDIYDEIGVRVEKGSITVTPSGTGVYYIGEQITFSGTNTDSDTTYLFLTGPNLAVNGVKFENFSTNVQTGVGSSFTRAAVEADDTWSYRWNTAKISRLIDAGGYTIYAVSQPCGKSDLSDFPYATTTIQLRSPFVTVTTSGATVAKGDKLTISGTAQGNPDCVWIWIFGKNFYGDFRTTNLTAHCVYVESDSSFEFETMDTDYLAAGQYFVVVQHPRDGKFGINVNQPFPGWINGTGITPVQLTSLKASDAATALMNALNSPDVDDIYTNITFTIAEPRIFIDSIGNQTAGSTFTISGITNLAAGNKLNVEVAPAESQPGAATDLSSVSGTAIVRKGENLNTWSFEVDATGFRPDLYIVTVECIEVGMTATAAFNVIEGAPTPSPGESLTLAPGWNFVSVPRPLAAGNDTAAIFAGVDSDSRSIFRYDSAARDWAALDEEDRLAPLEGIWIYSVGPATVPLNFSTKLPIPPMERSLVAGWNAVGITGTTPPAARDAFLSVDGQWTTLIGFDAGTQTFETGIANGGSGEYADSRQVYPGRGYWLYMTGPGTLCAIGA